MSAPATLLVVEDDDGVRDSLTALLQSEGYTAVSAYASGQAFLDDQAATGQCLILDIRMPGISGLAVLEELSRRQSGIPVVVMTGHGDVATAVRAMKAGAIDFVEKPFLDETMLGAIRRAIVMGTEAGATAAAVKHARALVAGLTQREREVLDQIVAGRASKVAGFELGISPRTIEVHRGRIAAKLKAHSLSQVIYTALIARRADVSASMQAE